VLRVLADPPPQTAAAGPRAAQSFVWSRTPPRYAALILGWPGAQRRVDRAVGEATALAWAVHRRLELFEAADVMR